SVRTPDVGEKQGCIHIRMSMNTDFSIIRCLPEEIRQHQETAECTEKTRPGPGSRREDVRSAVPQGCSTSRAASPPVPPPRACSWFGRASTAHGPRGRTPREDPAENPPGRGSAHETPPRSASSARSYDRVTPWTPPAPPRSDSPSTK